MKNLKKIIVILIITLLILSFVSILFFQYFISNLYNYSKSTDDSSQLCNTLNNWKNEFNTKSEKFNSNTGKISAVLYSDLTGDINFEIQEVSERYSQPLEFFILDNPSIENPLYISLEGFSRLFTINELNGSGFYQKSDTEYLYVDYAESFRCMVSIYINSLENEKLLQFIEKSKKVLL